MSFTELYLCLELITIKTDDISIKKRVFVTGIAKFFIVVFIVIVYLEIAQQNFY